MLPLAGCGRRPSSVEEEVNLPLRGAQRLGFPTRPMVKVSLETSGCQDERFCQILFVMISFYTSIADSSSKFESPSNVDRHIIGVFNVLELDSQ